MVVGMAGVDLIRAERTYQIVTKDYSAKHDAAHGVDELVALALGYLTREAEGYERQRNLTKAGALLAAAIDTHKEGQT